MNLVLIHTKLSSFTHITHHYFKGIKTHIENIPLPQTSPLRVGVIIVDPLSGGGMGLD
jgi:hypothetical protein